MNTIDADTVQYLARPEGRIAYTVTGHGPLVVAVPGMGDLRSTYRELIGPLVDAGFRVAVTDLRGHGDSDPTFRAHGDIETARDIIALIDELGGPAVVIGNSMGGSAAIWAAAERSDAVAGLVLFSPFVRQPSQSRLAATLYSAMFQALLARPWGVSVWAGYYAKNLNPGRTATWLAEHVGDIRTALSRKGYLAQFRRLAGALDHSVIEPRVAEVHAPALVMVGALDPDYTDAAAELAHMGEVLHAETVLVPDAGHYVQHQAADVAAPRTLAFVERLRGGAGAGDGWKAAPRA